ncbi:polysaccharide deacetylase family protein [bacterium]|nr:polysaccharide deacetylase family protein [bacterium]
MKKLNYNRRGFLKVIAAAPAILSLPGCGKRKDKIKYIITLSYDDGFKKSCIKTAEIYEKYNLSACFNVMAESSKSKDDYHVGVELGNFELWNELKIRGHEIMPHGYNHSHLNKITFEEAKELITKCLNIFSDKLEGFNPKQSVFNFPYNSSTPQLEKWITTRVMAYRSGGGYINPLPYKGQAKLATGGFGPGNCEKHLDNAINELFAKPSSWLIYNAHGLDDEGWGPMSSGYLDSLLSRLSEMKDVKVLPAGKALLDKII